jgi:D-aminoacyl-tRNA deacylase
MIVLLQRVKQAHVQVSGLTLGEIAHGLLIFLCAEPHDHEALADQMLAKILKLRVFSDAAGKMNLSVQDVHGGLLIVSQFTLAADLSGGNRPSFKHAAEPGHAKRLYEHFVHQARAQHPVVQSGQFAADMQVHLQNDGPITIPITMRVA